MKNIKCIFPLYFVMMNNRYILFLPVLMLSLLSTVSAQQRYDLHLDLTPGNSYRMKQHAITVTKVTVESQVQKTSTTIDGTMSFKVMAKDAGIYKMEAKYDALSIVSGNEVAGSTSSLNQNDIFEAIAREMVNRPFTISIRENGTVTEMKNLDSVYAHMFDPFPSIDPAKKEQIYNSVRQSFGEDAMKKSIEQVTAVLPGHPVAIGDEWQKNTEFKTTVDFNIQTKYKLAAIENGIVKIKSTGGITNGFQKNITLSGSLIDLDMTGSITHEFQFDAASGWIKHSEGVMDISGKMIFHVSEQIPQEMQVPLQIKLESETDN